VTPTLAALLAYLAIQFGIGIWASRRIRDEADYLVGGRRLGYWLATFSIYATWFGAETIVGSGGRAYRDGVSLASAEPFGYALCLALMGLIFAVPLWRRKLTTLADLYRERFSPGVERFAAMILIPGSILWAAAQIRAFGHVLTTASSGLQGETGIAIAASVVILYTMFGGLLADAMTDLVQGIMLAVGLAVVLGAVVLSTGGPASTIDTLGAAGTINLVPPTGAAPLALLEEWAVPVCGSLLATELVGRVIAARSPEVARRSSYLAAALYLGVGIIPVIIGLLGSRFVTELADAEQIVPVIARELLPTALYAIFAGGLVSAILSTVDSTLLVSSGLLSHNLVVPVLGVTDERIKVRIARGGVVAFGCIAFALALRAEGVFALVEQASAFGSAGVLVTVSFGLFTRFGGPLAAWATLVTGLATYLWGSFTDHPYPFLTSLAAAVLMYVVIAVAESRKR
jgi:solute:Na+ symporter, SSS family